VFEEAGVLKEDIVVAGLGTSFKAGATWSLAPNLGFTPRDYHAPELLLDTANSKGTQAVDIWSLGCLIFEIRTGPYSPFSSVYFDVDETLESIVNHLGRLPEPWWSTWKNRSKYFDEAGTPLVSRAGMSIRSALEYVGTPEHVQARPALTSPTLFDKPVPPIPEEELILLDDLLNKMFKYRPEERITIEEVIRHPWFAFPGGSLW
jgi:serine/threonine-protein kinase SRPK3